MLIWFILAFIKFICAPILGMGLVCINPGCIPMLAMYMFCCGIAYMPILGTAGFWCCSMNIWFMLGWWGLSLTLDGLKLSRLMSTLLSDHVDDLGVNGFDFWELKRQQIGNLFYTGNDTKINWSKVQNSMIFSIHCKHFKEGGGDIREVWLKKSSQSWIQYFASTLDRCIN